MGTFQVERAGEGRFIIRFPEGTFTRVPSVTATLVWEHGSGLNSDGGALTDCLVINAVDTYGVKIATGYINDVLQGAHSGRGFSFIAIGD